MQKQDCWPPPENWAQVVITWTTMLENSDRNPNEIIAWVEAYPGAEYHLHGCRSTEGEGFAFRFSDPNDALIFQLRWAR